MTAAEARLLANAAHDVPDAVLEAHLLQAQRLAEEVAAVPLERREVEFIDIAHHDGVNLVYLPGYDLDITTFEVDGVDHTNAIVLVSSSIVAVHCERGSILHVVYEAGYPPSAAPMDLKLTLAQAAVILLQEAGYAQTDSWLGRETMSVNTPDGTRTFRRADLEDWLRERLVPYAAFRCAGVL